MQLMCGCPILGQLLELLCPILCSITELLGMAFALPKKMCFCALIFLRHPVFVPRNGGCYWRCSKYKSRPVAPPPTSGPLGQNLCGQFEGLLKMPLGHNQRRPLNWTPQMSADREDLRRHGCKSRPSKAIPLNVC